MAVLRLYPNAIRPGSGGTDFSDAQLTQLLGNSSNTISKNASYPVNTGMYASFFFDTTQVPAGAIINSITASTQAYATYSTTRAFYSFSSYHPTYGSMLRTLQNNLSITIVTGKQIGRAHV